MRQDCRTVYQFDELSDSAKDKARDWYRSGLCQDTDWAECVLSQAVEAGQMLGIRFCTHAVPLMNGSSRQEPIIYWDLSRSAGCSFSAFYYYAKGSAQRIRAEWPQDRELQEIADRLRRAQQKAFYRLSAKVDPTRSHNALEIDIERTDGANVTGWQADTVAECLNDFAAWILSSLNRELEYIHSDECIDENIRANEYEFLENGAIA